MAGARVGAPEAQGEDLRRRMRLLSVSRPRSDRQTGKRVCPGTDDQRACGVQGREQQRQEGRGRPHIQKSALWA